MDVSIIIVNYNTKTLLADCIKSIKEQTKNIEYEIIVSDNGSSDGSKELICTQYPDVIYIENNKNLGFGAANNAGLNKAQGKYVFYLNSDTLLLNNAVKIFFDYFEENNKDNSIGALGCNLLDRYGNITASYDSNFVFKKDFLRFVRDYLYLWNPRLKNAGKKSFTKYVGPVDVIIGADLFMLNNENARFDEYFFLYHEETDLQYNNLQKKNLKRLIIDGPEIKHLEGGSNKKTENKYDFITSFSRMHDRLSKVKYYRKNGKKYQADLLKFLLLFIWNDRRVKAVTGKFVEELKRV